MFFFENPNLRRLKTDKVLATSGGTNLVDTTDITLPNYRGNVFVALRASDDPDNYQANFRIQGGAGASTYQESKKDWHIIPRSEINCTVTKTTDNIFEVETNASVFGGVDRTYTITFSRGQAVSPTIQRTAGTIVGTNDLTVTFEKYNVIQV